MSRQDGNGGRNRVPGNPDQQTPAQPAATQGAPAGHSTQRPPNASNVRETTTTTQSYAQIATNRIPQPTPAQVPGPNPVNARNLARNTPAARGAGANAGRDSNQIPPHHTTGGAPQRPRYGQLQDTNAFSCGKIVSIVWHTNDVRPDDGGPDRGYNGGDFVLSKCRKFVVNQTWANHWVGFPIHTNSSYGLTRVSLSDRREWAAIRDSAASETDKGISQSPWPILIASRAPEYVDCQLDDFHAMSSVAYVHIEQPISFSYKAWCKLEGQLTPMSLKVWNFMFTTSVPADAREHAETLKKEAATTTDASTTQTGGVVPGAGTGRGGGTTAAAGPTTATTIGTQGEVVAGQARAPAQRPVEATAPPRTPPRVSSAANQDQQPAIPTTPPGRELPPGAHTSPTGFDVSPPARGNIPGLVSSSSTKPSFGLDPPRSRRDRKKRR